MRISMARKLLQMVILKCHLINFMDTTQCAKEDNSL